MSVTSIACSIDQTASIPLCTRVQQNYSHSRPDLRMIFDAPVVTSIHPQNAVNAAESSSITVLGVNFGAVAGEPGHCANAVVRVTVGDTACSTFAWISNTALRCQVPKLAWSKAFPPVRVISSAGRVAEGSDSGLRLDGPVLTAVLPVNLPRAVNSVAVTVLGANFGFSANDALITMRAGIGVCETIAGSRWISGTAVQCLAQIDRSTLSDQVVVTVDGKGGLIRWAYSYDPPILTAIAPMNGPRDSTDLRVTLSGCNFSPVGSGSTWAARIGARWCLDTKFVDDGTITCTPPPGAGRNTVGLTMSSQFDRSVKVEASVALTGRFRYNAPVVTWVSPGNAPSCGGATITLQGANFGSLSTVDVSSSVWPSWWRERSANQRESTIQVVESILGESGLIWDDAATTAVADGLGVSRDLAASLGTSVNMTNLFRLSSVYTRSVALGATDCTNLLWRSDAEMSCVAERSREEIVDVVANVDGRPIRVVQVDPQRGSMFPFQFKYDVLVRYVCLEFGACSISCSPFDKLGALVGGTQARTCTCEDTYAGTAVAEAQCADDIVPDLQRPCTPPPCEPQISSAFPAECTIGMRITITGTNFGSGLADLDVGVQELNATTLVPLTFAACTSAVWLTSLAVVCVLPIEPNVLPIRVALRVRGLLAGYAKQDTGLLRRLPKQGAVPFSAADTGARLADGFVPVTLTWPTLPNAVGYQPQFRRH